MRVSFGVLGPVTAWDDTGAPIALKGPRHRAVLARLIAARGRVVPLGDLVTDLWVAPPAGANAAVRTFVAALRRAIEPERPPRVPPTLLVTEGPGYALRAAPDTVDAWRFETAVRTGGPARLEEALSWWRGPAYADFADAGWTGAERARLAELRLRAVEQLAEARLAAGDPAGAVPDLDAHATEHPWREQAWHLLALALYRTGRQPDALAVLRRARTMLADQLGLDPTPALRRLEQDILRQSPTLTPPPDPAEPDGQRVVPPPAETGSGPRGAGPRSQDIAPTSPDIAPTSPDAAPTSQHAAPTSQHAAPTSQNAAPTSRGVGSGAEQGAPGPGGVPDPAGQVWVEAAADYHRIVAAGARARLDSTVDLLRTLAVTGGGGLVAARRHRVAAITAAEELGDPDLTARVIGAYDVPAIWTRADDPAQSALVVAAARRALTRLAADPAGTADPASPADPADPASPASPASPAEPSGPTGQVDPPGPARRRGEAGGAGTAARTRVGAPDEGRAARARLLATIAVESRGTAADAGSRAAAVRAVRIARELDDPALLAFALNGLFMQSTHRVGLAAERDRIGQELVAVAGRPGLVTAEVLGRLVRMQALAALGDFAAAGEHAARADELAARHELPLVGVFTTWFRAMRVDDPIAGEAAYRDAGKSLADSGMPGLVGGLRGLGLLTVRVRGGLPVRDDDFGPYEPWARPHVLLAEGRAGQARRALRDLPAPPPDLMAEVLWCLTAHAAARVGDQATVVRAGRALWPARREISAGSGLVSLGAVAQYAVNAS